jgi:CheY-like chemotaxis protein
MPDSKCLLVVEDDVLTREVFTTILTGQGYTVRGAADGLQALDHLREGSLPDCILLDLGLPGMTGRQFLTRQTQHQLWAAVPVVLVSGDPRVAEEAALLGAADYLRKPVEPQALLEVVRKNC